MTSRRNCIAGFAGSVSARQQRLVLAEDRGLELLELRAGVDAELLEERLAGGSVGGERVCLAPRAVEREHQLRAGPLAHGLRGDERFELGDELGMTTEREIGLDPLLEHGGSQVLEPRDLGLGERFVQEVRERRPLPERERVAKCTLAGGRVPGVERGATLLCEPREPVDVDSLRLELEDVAGRARDKRRCAECLP